MVRDFEKDLKINPFVANFARFFVFFSFGYALYSTFISYLSNSFGLISFVIFLGALLQIYIYSQIVPTVYLYYTVRKESETNFNKLVTSDKFIDSRGNVLGLNLDDRTLILAGFINVFNIIYTFSSFFYSLVSSSFSIFNLFWFFYGLIQFYVFLHLVNSAMAYNDLAKEMTKEESIKYKF